MNDPTPCPAPRSARHWRSASFEPDGNVAVPQDIALIGYDDIDFARSAVVPLSSIRQPSTQIGTAAIDLLTAVADVDYKPQHIVYQPELIVRSSTDTR